MSDLLSDEKIKQLCVKHLAWDEPVGNRDLELIKPLFKAQSVKTKKGMMKLLEARECGERNGRRVIELDEWEWQALQKGVEDGCPLCGKPSKDGKPHKECMDREAMLADRPEKPRFSPGCGGDS